MKYFDNDNNSRELELLDTSKELTKLQILKVFDSIYNFGQLDFETQTLIKAFKRLLTSNSNESDYYTKLFNKYKIIGKKYFYDDDYETVFDTMFYVTFKKEMPDSVKVKIIKEASLCENQSIDMQY